MKHTNTPKGEMIPQTVDSLQEIMALDAEMMMLMAKEVGVLKNKINRLEQKLNKMKRNRV